ncbi:MAG: DNA-processing protein DprA [Bacillota bacterium]|nr:DNA-processing protein DprA [Bacillota bacterium]
MYEEKDRLAAVWMSRRREIGAVSAQKLITFAGGYRNVLCLSEREMENAGFLTDKQRKALSEALNDGQTKEDARRDLDRMKQHGIRILLPEEDAFPEKLRRIPDPPMWLYVRGSLPDPDQKSCALIGARNCTEYGKEEAEYFGGLLGDYGIPVISGMARGIDSFALRGALEKGGDCYAVLGCGVNVCYPQEAGDIFSRISEKGGILSEYPLDGPALSQHFPVRNRIISGLADMVLIVEAKRKSGSLITADLALDQGKDIFALPGRRTDPLSEGTNRLIRVGAGIVTGPEDVLEYFGIRGEKGRKQSRVCDSGLVKNEKKVYSAIDSHPRHIEEIMNRSGLSWGECLVALMKLEICGLAVQPDNQYYMKKLDK